MTQKAAVAKDDVEGEGGLGGAFELKNGRLPVCAKKKKTSCDLAKFVIYSVIYLCYPPKTSGK